MKKSKNHEIIIGPVRLSFLKVFEPRVSPIDGLEKYGSVLLIPKESCFLCTKPQAILNQLEEVEQDIIKELYSAGVPEGFKHLVQDGESSSITEYPEYYLVNSESLYQPKLVDINKEPVTEGWNSGDWANVKLSINGYVRDTSSGVGARLIAIQFLHKDETFIKPSKALEGF